MTQKNLWIHDIKPTDIFEEEVVDDLLSLARRRIIVAFEQQTVFYRNKERRTENFIHSVEERPRRLAQHIITSAQPFVSPRLLDKPSVLEAAFGRKAYKRGRSVPQKELDRLAKRIEQILIEAMLNQMIEDHDIWFMNGVWNICQSQIDQYRKEIEAIRRASNRVRYDRRNEHGKIRNHRKSREIPAGMSVALTGPGSTFVGLR